MTVEHFPIEAGHVMSFARAIGDPNPIYHDEEHARRSECGRIIAPPTFVQASAQFDPDYRLRPRPGEAWQGSGREPTGRPSGQGGGGGGALHAEQHYTYHRPVAVGDVLSVVVRPGETWERDGRRGGKLRFSETYTEYRDQGGELVVTARAVAVRTERAVEPG
ncbi:MAG: FAS1-like dehydratase domain-containing protein [Acidimicrobiales bacterium]